MGAPVRYEPNNLDALSAKKEVFSIFWEVGWIKYFQRLNGFHEEIKFQLALNLIGEHSEIRGLRIDVSEWALAEATRLPRIGNRWFYRKRHNLTTIECFLAAREKVQQRSIGIVLDMLPRPWDQVVIFLKSYIACEGRYRVVYIYAMED